MSYIHIASQRSGSFLTGVEDDAIQPNAVDLCIDKVWSIHGGFILSKDDKKHRQRIELKTENGFYNLSAGTYEISFGNTIKMAADEAGWVITRSTLIRNGLMIITGLYDSGYEGAMAAGLFVGAGPASIEKGARVGQFILSKAEALHEYDGSYGIKNGVVKEDEKRYHE